MKLTDNSYRLVYRATNKPEEGCWYIQKRFLVFFWLTIWTRCDEAEGLELLHLIALQRTRVRNMRVSVTEEEHNFV